MLPPHLSCACEEPTDPLQRLIRRTKGSFVISNAFLLTNLWGLFEKGHRGRFDLNDEKTKYALEKAEEYFTTLSESDIHAEEERTALFAIREGYPALGGELDMLEGFFKRHSKEWSSEASFRSFDYGGRE